VTPIVFYGEHTASLSLYLDGLGPELADRITILPPTNLAADFKRLAAAGVVAYVRGFEAVATSGLDSALARLGVQRVWFTDDDLTALHGEQPGFHHYSQRRVERFADRMLALVGTTPALCARLRSFHSNVLYWPCLVDEALVPPRAVDQSGPLRIGVIGGDFRRAGLHDLVIPAIAATTADIELLLAQPIGSGIPGATLLPFQPDFRRFIAAWRAAGPHILAHPPGRTRNIATKSAGLLLASLYLGAVPVVADEPAFAGLGKPEGVIRVGAGIAQWREALHELSSPDVRAEYFANLARYCRTAFNGGGPRPAIDFLLDRAASAASTAPSRQRMAHRMAWRPNLSFSAATIIHAMLSSTRTR
jgi:hypothetical protein